MESTLLKNSYDLFIYPALFSKTISACGARADDIDWVYDYILKDQLGNMRMV